MPSLWTGCRAESSGADDGEHARVSEGEAAMERMSRIGVAAVCAVVSLPASAALMYEARSGSDGEVQDYTMYVDGPDSRMGADGARQFVLMNWKDKTLYMVDTASKQATDMSMGLKQRAAAQKCPQPEVEAVLEHLGAGPQLAGYATEHYVLKADGKACEEIFASKKAFGELGAWLDNVREMEERDDEDVGRSKCDIAADKALDLSEIGWPLKTITLRGPGKGQVEEVLRIEKDVSVPAGFFDVPAGYKIVTLEQLYPELAGKQGSGSMPQLPCPSFDEYDDYDDDKGYGGDEYYEEGPVEEAPEDMEGTGEDDTVEESVKDTVEGLFNGLKKGLGG